jgi:predicted metal-dependent phosphoesterase TrpH
VIDLHSHTDQSDGSCSPAQLIELACRAGVRILAITDHDTFAGYDQVSQSARDSGLELICGIELSTKLFGRTAHLLGYFMHHEKLQGLRTWLLDTQRSRHERNRRLIARLQELGLDIQLEEVEARGRGMTGRPHFAQIMVEKGYARNLQEAFDNYLDESAKGYVPRHEPEFTEVVQKIREAGGIASLAHPVRLKGDVSSMLPVLCEGGLNAIEAYHSDHNPHLTETYLRLAKTHGLLVTGGSDFHGSAKPDIELGTGLFGNLKIPEDLVERMRIHFRPA